MKRVRIHAGKVGLVFKNGDYKRVITQGSHWLTFNEHVIDYSLNLAFNTPTALEVLLKDQTLAAMLHVINVEDNQMVLVYSNSNFRLVHSNEVAC